MIRLVIFSFCQAAMMAVGQAIFKLGMEHIDNFTWSWYCVLHQILLNGGILFGSLLVVVGNLVWIYMLKEFPFSVIYPLTSLGFAMGLIVSAILLHEPIDWGQWFGVALIMAGCYFVVK